MGELSAKATRKKSISISKSNTKGQSSLNYQSALQQLSDYSHHLEWPLQYFEIMFKTVVVINQGDMTSQHHDQQKDGDRY